MIQVSVKKAEKKDGRSSPAFTAREEHLSLASGALAVGNVTTITEPIDEDRHLRETANLSHDKLADSFNLGSILITDEIDPISPRIEQPGVVSNDKTNEVFMNVPRLAAMLTVNRSRGNNYYARAQDLQHKRMEEALTIRRVKRPLSAPRTVVPKRILPEHGANIYLPNAKSLLSALVARKVIFRPDKRIIEIDPAIFTQTSPFNSPRAPDNEENADKLQQMLEVSLEEYYSHQAPGGSLWQKPGMAIPEQPLAKQLFPSLTLSAVQPTSLEDSQPATSREPLSARMLPLPDQVKHALAIHGQGQRSNNSTAPNSARPLSSRTGYKSNKRPTSASATTTTRRSASMPEEEEEPPIELSVDQHRSDNNPLPRPFRRPGLPGLLRRGRASSPPPALQPPHYHQQPQQLQQLQQQPGGASDLLYNQHKQRDMEQLTKLFQFADLQVISGAGIQEALQLSDSMLIGDHERDPDMQIHGDHYSNYYYNTYSSKHDNSHTNAKSSGRSRGWHNSNHLNNNNNNVRSQSPPSSSVSPSALILKIPQPAEASPSLVASSQHDHFPSAQQQQPQAKQREQTVLHQPKHPIVERQPYPSITSPRRALMQRAHEIVLEHERNLLKSGYDVPISILTAAVNNNNNNQENGDDKLDYLLSKDMQMEMQRQVHNYKQITNQEKRPLSPPPVGSAPPLQFAPEFYNHLHLQEGDKDDVNNRFHEDDEIPLQFNWKRFLTKPANVISKANNDHPVLAEEQATAVIGRGQNKGRRPQSAHATFQSSTTAAHNNKPTVKETLPLLPPNAIGGQHQQTSDLVPLLSFTSAVRLDTQDTVAVKINKQVVSPRLDDKINAANADYQGQALHQTNQPQHVQMIASPPPASRQQSRPSSAVILSRTNRTIANSKALPGRMLQRDPQSPEPSPRRHEVEFYSAVSGSELRLPSGAEGVAMLQQIIQHDQQVSNTQSRKVANNNAIVDERPTTQPSTNPRELVELVDASNVPIIQRREHPLRDQQKMYGQYVQNRNYDRQVKKLSKQHPNNYESKVTIASSSMKVPAMSPAPHPSQTKGKVSYK